MKPKIKLHNYFTNIHNFIFSAIPYLSIYAIDDIITIEVGWFFWAVSIGKEYIEDETCDIVKEVINE